MTDPDIPRRDAPGPAPDDDLLMAHADGALSGAAAAAVARAIAGDPDVARRHAVFVATRARLADLAATQGAVPDALQARVAALVAAHRLDRADRAAERAGAQVLPLRRWQRPAPVWAVPLAASLALAVGLAAGLVATGGGPTGAAGPTFGTAAVQSALDRLATGETAAIDGAALRIVGSFRDAADQLCREAVLSPAAGDGAQAVLCRASDGGWRVELALRQPAAAAGGALSAASGQGAVDAFLGDIGAGPALDPTAEARALAE